MTRQRARMRAKIQKLSATCRKTDTSTRNRTMAVMTKARVPETLATLFSIPSSGQPNGRRIISRLTAKKYTSPSMNGGCRTGVVSSAKMPTKQGGEMKPGCSKGILFSLHSYLC